MGRELENARRHVYLAIEALRPRVPICPPHVATSQTQKCVMSHVNFTISFILSHTKYEKQGIKRPTPRANTCSEQKYTMSYKQMPYLTLQCHPEVKMRHCHMSKLILCTRFDAKMQKISDNT